jgi:hypothetical protein
LQQRLILLTWIVLASLGCVTKTYPPRPNDWPIDVFHGADANREIVEVMKVSKQEADVPRGSETIGRLSCKGAPGASWGSVLDSAQKKARSLGGDGIIVNRARLVESGSGFGSTKSKELAISVVRYKQAFDPATRRFATSVVVPAAEVRARDDVDVRPLLRLLVVRRGRHTAGRDASSARLRSFLADAFRATGAFERVVLAEDLVAAAAVAQDPDFLRPADVEALRAAAGPAMVADAELKEIGTGRFRLTLSSAANDEMLFDVDRTVRNCRGLDESLVRPALNAALAWIDTRR